MHVAPARVHAPEAEHGIAVPSHPAVRCQHLVRQDRSTGHDYANDLCRQNHWLVAADIVTACRHFRMDTRWFVARSFRAP